jgi:hypothetical protein
MKCETDLKEKMKTVIEAFLVIVIAGLTIGCATHELTQRDIQLSAVDMKSIRELIGADSAISPEWSFVRASYMMNSRGTTCEVSTNWVSVVVRDTHSSRGVNVTFLKSSSGQWQRIEIERTLGDVLLVGNISYEIGEKTIHAVLSSSVATSNGFEYVGRIYAIPDASTARGPECDTWMSDWQRYPETAQYLVDLYKESTYAKETKDWGADETYAEFFVRMQEGKALIVGSDILSRAIEITRYNAKYIAEMIFNVWVSGANVISKEDRELLARVTSGCPSDRFSARLVRESPILDKSNSKDGWGTPFRLRLDPSNGTFSVVSAGRNKQFGDSDDMQRIWDFKALRDRQLLRDSQLQKQLKQPD